MNEALNNIRECAPFHRSRKKSNNDERASRRAPRSAVIGLHYEQNEILLSSPATFLWFSTFNVQSLLEHDFQLF